MYPRSSLKRRISILQPHQTIHTQFLHSFPSLNSTMHAIVATQLYITSIMAIMIWTSFGGLLWGVAHKNNGDYPLFTIDLTTKDYKQVALLMDKPTEVIYDCINDKMYVAQGGEFIIDEIDMSDGNIIKTLYVDGKWPALEYVDGILYGYTASSYV
eukprot:676_1